MALPESIPLRLKIIEIDKVVVKRELLFLPSDVHLVDASGIEMVAHELNREINLFGHEDWVTYGAPIEFNQAIGDLVGGSPLAHGRLPTASTCSVALWHVRH